MLKNSFFIIISQILLTAIVVQCKNAETFNSEFNQFKQTVFAIKDIDVSKVIRDIMFSNWTGNCECSTELNVIQSARKDNEEWACKITDAWGTIPSGVLSRNFYDFGSFSECFDIHRNGNHFKTQYCVARLIQKSSEPIQRDQLIKIGAWKIWDTFTPSITVGLCLPAACAVKKLESEFNRHVHTKLSNVTVIIPEKYCQFKESFPTWRAIDFAAIGLMSVVLLLMIASTGYDLFCKISNRTKYQPLLMFSVYTNGIKLFSCQTSMSPDSIECLHGIRVLTAVWVVFGHSYRYGFNFQSIEAHRYTETYRAALMYAVMKVEIFFAISALLASIKMFNSLKSFPHTWFLSVDMQLYIITPLIVYLIHRLKAKALCASAVSILVGMGYIVASHISYGVTDFYSSLRNVKDHCPTHTRFPAWFVGIIAGYIFVKFPNESIRIPKLVNLFAWTLSIATITCSVFGAYQFYQLINPKSTALEFGLFTASTRVVWPIAVCYIIFACARGYGGPINSFLSHPNWQPLARLSYAVYLVHFPLIQIAAPSDSPPNFNEFRAFQFFIAVCVLSFFVAIPATLAFVSPLDTIDQLILASDCSHSKKSK